jgi:hypothetical protein
VWQGAGQDVYSVAAVEFPSGAWTQRLSAIRPPPEPMDVSSDGTWRAALRCIAACEVSFTASDGRATSSGFLAAGGGLWAPIDSAYAFVDVSHIPGAESIVVVPDVSEPKPTVVYRAPVGTYISAFAWHGVNQFVVAEDDGTSTRFALVNVDGTRRSLDDLVVAPGVGVSLHVAPGTDVVALTATGVDETRVMTIDLVSGAATDLGSINRQQPGECRPRPPYGVPEPQDGFSPITAGPDGTSGSPDGSRLAFVGPRPPFVLTMIDLTTGAVLSVTFGDAHPGEVAWSPDGTMIAVGTFDEALDRHEAWIVDAATGEGRYLLDACQLVWSPDSRFLAVRGRDRPGLAIIEVETGVRLQVTQEDISVPIRWMPAQ